MVTYVNPKRDTKERDREKENDPYKEKIITINRVSKVVKGGRRFSFSALVVVGDGLGTVGLGYGKANEVAEAIRKGIQDAKNHFFKVPLIGTTLPYQMLAEVGAAKVLLKPARPGTGIIAGGAVRSILELAGVRDVVAKNLGTKNQINSAKATIFGLQSLKSPARFDELRRSPAKKKDSKSADVEDSKGGDAADSGNE